MCGRLNISDDPFTQMVCKALGISFSAQPNSELRPSEKVSSIGISNQGMVQLELGWGIKPEWAKRLIINAQAESVSVKPTFRTAFQTNRVIVPCSGWYEWNGEKGNKQRYYFTEPSKKPIYMAGIAIDDKLVTLTTKPNQQCSEYHHRMPLIIPEESIERWLFGDQYATKELLTREITEYLLVKTGN